MRSLAKAVLRLLRKPAFTTCRMTGIFMHYFVLAAAYVLEVTVEIIVKAGVVHRVPL